MLPIGKKFMNKKKKTGALAWKGFVKRMRMLNKCWWRFGDERGARVRKVNVNKYRDRGLKAWYKIVVTKRTLAVQEKQYIEVKCGGSWQSQCEF